MRSFAWWTSCVFALLALIVAVTGADLFGADSPAPPTQPLLGKIVSRTLLHAPDGTPDTRTTFGIGEPVEFTLVPSIDKSGRPVVPRLEDDALGILTWVMDGEGEDCSLWNITGEVTVVSMWGSVSVGVEAHAGPVKPVVPGK